MHVTKGNLNVNAMYHSSIRHENKVFGIGYSVSRNESHKVMSFIYFDTDIIATLFLKCRSLY